jgi:predicted glycosyltransferase
MTAFLCALGGYLAGSIPFAIVVSRIMALPDPRTYGSKNIGATNVLRSGNRVAALLTLLGDAGKGWAAVLAARALGLRTVTLMDYEHQPANHLAFRLASRVVVPESFPAEALRRFGAGERKVRRYRGIKEDVYLADFEPDPDFAGLLMKGFGIDLSRDTLVVVRPPAREALYHRFENELFDGLLARLLASPNVKVLLLARTDAQREEIVSRFKADNLFAPREALDGANLVAAADLVVSAGGTMNREAAALGVPAATVYAGRWAAIDEYLVREGRLKRIASREDLESLRVEKKGHTSPRRRTDVRAEVAELILDEG